MSPALDEGFQRPSGWGFQGAKLAHAGIFHPATPDASTGASAMQEGFPHQVLAPHGAGSTLRKTLSAVAAYGSLR